MLRPSEAETLLEGVVDDYFDACRGRVDGFVNRHFRYPGVWQTNRSALGWDLLRAPLNLFWAPVYVLGLLLAWLFQRLGWSTGAALLRKTPPGLTTTVQRHVAELIDRELLGAGEPELSGPGSGEDLSGDLQSVIAQALRRYTSTRTASADITNSVLSTAVGAFAFQKFTPGGLAMGVLLAAWWARERAIGDFFLGDWFGRLYYSIFPVEPSLGLQALGVGTVLCILAAFASLSGLLTDPIQSRIGLHQRRLRKLIDHLQTDFENRRDSSFSPKDPYIARLLELLDAAKMI